MKKIIVTTALYFFLTTSVQAQTFMMPFYVAMNTDVPSEFSETFPDFEAEQTFENKDSIASSQSEISEVILDSENQEKWTVVKDFNEKPASVSGRLSFVSNPDLKVEAHADYTFPVDVTSDTENIVLKQRDNYFLGVKVEVAL